MSLSAWIQNLVPLTVAVAALGQTRPEGRSVILGDPLMLPEPAPPVRDVGPASPVTIGSAINIASREEVRNFFNTVYAAGEEVARAWDGDYATCQPGSPSASFEERVALRVNYFRSMAGVPADVVFRSDYSAKAQAAALIMSASGALNHYPPVSWPCYSPAGAEAAGKANLALGTSGPDAVTGYIEDPGTNNATAGHRRWLLYPQTKSMGTGDVPGDEAHWAANALWILDDQFGGARPPTRDDFVSWPPPGYVPYRLVFPRWSFSYPSAGFSGATVTVTSNGVPATVHLDPPVSGAADNSLVWTLNDSDPINSGFHPKPIGEVTYTVQINGVADGGATRQFSYSVKVFDPDVPGPDTVRPIVTGPAAPAAGQATAYSFVPVPRADSHEARLSRMAALNAIEGAEDGLVHFTQSVTPGYSVIIGAPRVSGNHAIHLTHLEPAAPQILAYSKTVLPGANARITLKSRLGYATTNQHARIQVSADGLTNWRDVFHQAGTGAAGETSYKSRSASLADYAGRSLAVRLVFDYSGGPYFADPQTNVGWLIDDLAFESCSEPTALVTIPVSSGNAFSVTAPAAGPYAIEARARIFGGFPLEWGPALVVTAANVPVLVRPAVASGKLQLPFNYAAATLATQFTLKRSASASGPWASDSTATLEKLGPTSFRFVVAVPPADTFFRVWAQ